MNFKLWLEADETHPFETWHKEYTDSRDAERKRRSGFEYRRYRNLPHPPEPAVSTETLRKDPRVQNLEVVDVLSLYNFSSGAHSWGDEPDIPASDPAHGAEWEILIDGATEKKLIGRPAFVADDSGGSFHERWLNIKVCVIVDELAVNNEIADYYTYPSYKVNHIIKTFRFESLAKTAEIVEELEPNLPPPNKEGESREDYWKRIMGSVDQTPPPDPTGYNPSDDYYKR